MSYQVRYMRRRRSSKASHVDAVKKTKNYIVYDIDKEKGLMRQRYYKNGRNEREALPIVGWEKLQPCKRNDSFETQEELEVALKIKLGEMDD